jgi:hypothetical protein
VIIEDVSPEIMSTPAALNLCRHFIEIRNPRCTRFLDAQALHKNARPVFAPPFLDNCRHFVLMRPSQTRSIDPPHKLDSDRRVKLTRPIHLSVFYQRKVAVSNQMPVRKDVRESRHCSLI